MPNIEYSTNELKATVHEDGEFVMEVEWNEAPLPQRNDIIEHDYTFHRLTDFTVLHPSCTGSMKTDYGNVQIRTLSEKEASVYSNYNYMGRARRHHLVYDTVLLLEADRRAHDEIAPSQDETSHPAHGTPSSPRTHNVEFVAHWNLRRGRLIELDDEPATYENVYDICAKDAKPYEQDTETSYRLVRVENIRHTDSETMFSFDEIWHVQRTMEKFVMPGMLACGKAQQLVQEELEKEVESVTDEASGFTFEGITNVCFLFLTPIPHTIYQIPDEVLEDLM